MMIWALGLVLLAALAGLGWRQGAIKVGFSFVGIVLGVLLAAPLGHLLSRLLGLIGVKDPLLNWALGPLLVFVLISAIAKIAAAAVHHKADVHYKYHAGGSYDWFCGRGLTIASAFAWDYSTALLISS